MSDLIFRQIGDGVHVSVAVRCPILISIGVGVTKDSFMGKALTQDVATLVALVLGSVFQPTAVIVQLDLEATKMVLRSGQCA